MTFDNVAPAAPTGLSATTPTPIEAVADLGRLGRRRDEPDRRRGLRGVPRRQPDLGEPEHHELRRQHRADGLPVVHRAGHRRRRQLLHGVHREGRRLRPVRAERAGDQRAGGDQHRAGRDLDRADRHRRLGRGRLRDLPRTASLIGNPSPPTAVTFTDTNVPGPGSYTYSVIAVDGAGNRSLSVERQDGHLRRHDAVEPGRARRRRPRRPTPSR